MSPEPKAMMILTLTTASLAPSDAPFIPWNKGKPQGQERP